MKQFLSPRERRRADANLARAAAAKACEPALRCSGCKRRPTTAGVGLAHMALDGTWQPHVWVADEAPPEGDHA